MLQVLFTQFDSDVPESDSRRAHDNAKQGGYDDDVHGLMQVWTAILRGC